MLMSRALPRTRFLALSAAAAAAALTADLARAQQAPAVSEMSMPALLGPYDMTREASGTSWQPDSTPMSGWHGTQGPWLAMVHGYLDLVYDDQGGPRGNSQSFLTGMLMFMLRRELAGGALGLRVMVSPDPAMGPAGYPELFQTGETADGVTPLIDRQHPHNLLMEAAVTYSADLAHDASVFVYAGPAGEPALGPPAFMHRLSAEDNPEAPLTHHWLDSTHVSYGVATAGVTLGIFKTEVSAFNGHEPDQHRYDVELGPLDSWAVRLSANPADAWSMQVSTGHLVSPEQLEPGVDVQRTTASLSYNAPLGQWWQTTAAWGHNAPNVGRASDGWLLESAAELLPRQTLFGRLERVAKDELFLPTAPLYGASFNINKLTLGYVYDVARLQSIRLGVGGLFSVYSFPSALDSTYGAHPNSFMLFVRARL
jgi:hypothetical protein